MGYLHINNFYREQDILLFKECYACEKIHGSSANIAWKATSPDPLTFFSGENPNLFVELFNKEALIAAFQELGLPFVTIFGEAYGGKCQGMKSTYGDKFKFIAFDVKVDESWLSVPQAEDIVVKRMGLEFVHYVKIPTDIALIDAQRDAESVQAIRNGCGPGKEREGVVLRPLVEVKKNNGQRIMAKHKRDSFGERATPQKIVDPATLKVLEEAQAIADEWVTPMRLEHVLSKILIDGKMMDPEIIPDLMKAMQEDVLREASGEIVDSKAARKAICLKTKELFVDKLKKSIEKV